MYFCVVLCIVCVYMCTELLPSGGYPIAVKYIILYHIISHHIISHHIISLIASKYQRQTQTVISHIPKHSVDSRSGQSYFHITVIGIH